MQDTMCEAVASDIPHQWSNPQEGPVAHSKPLKVKGPPNGGKPQGGKRAARKRAQAAAAVASEQLANEERQLEDATCALNPAVELGAAATMQQATGNVAEAFPSRANSVATTKASSTHDVFEASNDDSRIQIGLKSCPLLAGGENFMDSHALPQTRAVSNS